MLNDLLSSANRITARFPEMGEAYLYAAAVPVVAIVFFIGRYVLRAMVNRRVHSIDMIAVGFGDLEEMHKKGLITEEEYKTMRKRVAKRQLEQSQALEGTKTAMKTLETMELNPEAVEEILGESSELARRSLVGLHEKGGGEGADPRWAEPTGSTKPPSTEPSSALPPAAPPEDPLYVTDPLANFERDRVALAARPELALPPPSRPGPPRPPPLAEPPAPPPTRPKPEATSQIVEDLECAEQMASPAAAPTEIAPAHVPGPAAKDSGGSGPTSAPTGRDDVEKLLAKGLISHEEFERLSALFKQIEEDRRGS